MSQVSRRILQVLIFISLLLGGTWLRALAPSHEFPPERDAPTALVVATEVEGLDAKQWEPGLLPEATFRHRILASVATMVSPGLAPYRNYTFLPLFLSVLLLPLIPCLGWKKHGGLFYTSDGSLWALAFATISPVAFMGATSLTPFTFQGIAFLLLLLVSRSYALWPGALSALSMGFIMAIAVTVSTDVMWGLLCFFIAVFFGAGWTRLTLYWRTSHVILMLLATAVGLVISFLCDGLTVPHLPELETDGARLLVALELQLTWLCVYGVGVFAWGGLVAITLTQKDARWERLLAIFFPICFLFGLFLKGDVGKVFVIPLSVLTPLMVALVLTRLPKFYWRWWMGNLVLIGLCFGFVEAKKQAPETLLLRDSQALVKADLLPLKHNAVCDLALLGAGSSQQQAQLLWILRAYASGRKVSTQEENGLLAPVAVVPASSAWDERLASDDAYHCLMTLTLDAKKKVDYCVYLKKKDDA